MYAEQLPNIETVSHGGNEHNVLRHPAFGVVVLTERGGGGRPLFGSDLQHHSRVCLTIKRAELHRQHSRDRTLSQETVAEIEMSHAQFAQMITALGKGDGTPCTLRYAPMDPVSEEMPGILRHEAASETFQRETRASVKNSLDKVHTEVARLGALLASGKLSKTELRDIHFTLMAHLQNLPDNLAHVVTTAEKSIETMTAHAKVEVEAYLDSAVRRLGLESTALKGGAPALLEAHETVIDADLVKTLRNQTGENLMACKRALVRSHGDLEQAALYLRTGGH